MSGWSVCPTCAAVVTDPALHAAWHIAQEPAPEPVAEAVEVEPVTARWWPSDVALVATPAVIEQPAEPVEPDPLPVEPVAPVVEAPARTPVLVIAEET